MSKRLCTVDGEVGYFHIFEQFSNVIDASPLRDGHPGGQISQIYGIVEFKDRVARVDPTKIKFCDEDNNMLYGMNEFNEKLKRKNLITMNDFNEKLTKAIKDVGQELIDNAEEIVGTKPLLCRMTITINFDPEFDMFSPTIEFNKEYLCKRAIDRLSNEHSN